MEAAAEAAAKMAEDDASAHALATSRFEYLVACQMYGEQRRLSDPKADDVELLLRLHPGLRVAYVDRAAPTPVAAPPHHEHVYARAAVDGDDDGATYDAVLLVSDAQGVARETARVRLPCNPILGEGKPENQNVGMPFTRGGKVGMIDMNQDGYFEEALKLRNLLEEFEGGDPGGGGATAEEAARPVTIVGFPEHIFTQSSGFVTAIYMAMQERYFGTFFQRVLSEPLGVRFHYGHPDLLDKLHFLTRGGVASASKQINLSEDVFAGYKTVLRGGRIKFKEYHHVGKGRMTNLAEISAFFAKVSQGAACQLMSRDLYRLVKSLPLDRQLSLLHGGFGFYIINCLTMYLVQLTAFLLALLNCSGLLPYFQTGSAIAFTSITLWMPLLVALVLLMPDVLLVWHERGVRLGLFYLYGKIATLAPLYYLFIAQTRAYHFANTMRWGGADYYVTSRRVSITHAHLHELFMSYARSHFYPAIELLLVLCVALSFDAPSDMFNATWMLWLIGLALLYVPFLYNPNALRLASFCEDLALWREWVSPSGLGGDPSKSWRAWWEAGTPPAEAHGTATLLGQTVMATVYTYIAGGILLYGNTELDGGLVSAVSTRSFWQLSLGASVVVPAMAVAWFDGAVTSRCARLRLRTPLMVTMALLGVAWFVGVTQSVQLISPARLRAGEAWAGAAARTFYAVPTLFTHTMAWSFGLAACGAALQILQVRLPLARAVMRGLQRTRDYLLVGALTLPLWVLCWLVVPHYLQRKLVFQDSGFFFSDTEKGRRWCLISASCFSLLVIGCILYEVAWLMGYVNAPPFSWFSC